MNTINGSRMPFESVSFQKQDNIVDPVSNMTPKEANYLCGTAITKHENLDKVVKLTLSADKEIKDIADRCLAELHKSIPDRVEKQFVSLFHEYFSVKTNPNISAELKDNLPVPCKEIIETGVKSERIKGKNGRFVEAAEALLRAKFGETDEASEPLSSRSNRDFRTDPPPQTLNSTGMEPDGIAFLKLLSRETRQENSVTDHYHGPPSFKSPEQEINHRLVEASLQGS